MTSSAWADLGGGVPEYTEPRRRPSIIRATPAPDAEHRHAFAPMSGYCSCGLRDDGSTAEGSPAWRAARANSRMEARS